MGVPYDPPAFGDLGSVVGDAHFVVKELAANIADQPEQLTSLIEKSPLRVQLADAIRQRAQKGFEVPCSAVVVGLFLIGHRDALKRNGMDPALVVPGSERCYPGT